MVPLLRRPVIEAVRLESNMIEELISKGAELINSEFGVI
jgi:hypothetical protein